MSLSKAAQVDLVQNKIAKASKALADAETHVEYLKASIAAQTRLLDALMDEDGEKACTETGLIDIPPILTFKMPPMRPDSKLYKAKFQVKVSTVVREFMNYCELPAQRMLAYDYTTIQSVELQYAFQCFAAGVSCWPFPPLFSIKDRVEEEAIKFFEMHEVLPAGSVVPAPAFSTKDAPVKNRSMVLPAWCWVYVKKCE